MSKFNFSKLKYLGITVLLVFSTQAQAVTGKYFDRAIFVVFENTNYSNAIKQPFFNQLANQGAWFTNFMALTHPSQGNYIALTSGSLNGVTSNKTINLNVANIADLLDAKGITWKVYAEGYPGSCYTNASYGTYVRKHNPFISYLNIQTDSSRCANIVNAGEFDKDAKAGTLPNYVFYIPDMKNDGHDTNVAYADKWYAKRFTPYLNDSAFMKGTVLISTFDESSQFSSKNQIYTSIVGPDVKAGKYADALTLYSLMNLIEENWALGNLGKQDATATPIPNIWQ